MSRECTEELFRKDVADHTINILRDDGVYRHLSFTRNGSSIYRFDLITWPGYLCYCGDMGTYVFQRLTDMFQFFRADMRGVGDDLYISLSYWEEKLQAIDANRRNGAAVEWSAEKFKRVVKEQYVEWLRERRLDAIDRAELREAIDELLSEADDEHRAHDAASNFECHRFRFYDFWEHDLTDYTFQFTWCCFAIAWGIQQYDAAKELQK